MAAPTDSAQTPANSSMRRILPTGPTHTRVTKFLPERGYAESERITAEKGEVVEFNFIDFQTEVDIELLVTDTGFAEPQEGQMLSFTTPAETNALPFFGLAASTALTLMVMGKVKPVGEAGHVGKYAFKGWFNSNIGGPTGS